MAEEPEDAEERQNFASAKDGAKIVAANKEARKPGSLLDNDGDSFVKNECKAEKWVIIELAQVVNVDTIKVLIIVSGPFNRSKKCFLPLTECSGEKFRGNLMSS